jgi:hypothetical protein
MADGTFDGLVVPANTETSDAALEMASAYFSPALLNHSIRVYMWASALGAARDIPFDPELLYVASMFHDFGLVPEFDSHTISFERAGGHVARVFAAGARWPVERRKHLSELIFRHICGDRMEESVDPQEFLLARAAGLEITGRHADEIPPGFRAEVLQRHPRLGFVEEFLTLYRDQADRKPDGPPAASIRTDLDSRMSGNPLDAPLPAGG